MTYGHIQHITVEESTSIQWVKNKVDAGEVAHNEYFVCCSGSLRLKMNPYAFTANNSANFHSASFSSWSTLSYLSSALRRHKPESNLSCLSFKKKLYSEALFLLMKEFQNLYPSQSYKSHNNADSSIRKLWDFLLLHNFQPEDYYKPTT